MSYTQMELAEVFIKTGELDDALDALNQQLQMSPDDDNALRLRSSVLLRMGQPNNLQQALDDLEHLPDKTKDDYVQQSIIYERLEQIDNAIKSMKAAYQTSPNHERTVERLIELLTQEKRYQEVLELLHQVPQTWRWLLRQAEIHSLNENFEKSVDTLNQAQSHLEEVFPDLLSPVSRNTMAQIHIARGNAQFKLDKLDKAKVDLRDALYHIPNDTTISFNLGLIAARKNKLKQAVKQCQKALDNSSDYVRQSLIDVLQQDERYSELAEKLNL